MTDQKLTPYQQFQLSQQQQQQPPQQPPPMAQPPQAVPPAWSPPGNAGYIQPSIPQAANVSIPAYHMPDEASVAAAYEQHKEQTRFGPKLPFVQFPGPQGDSDWRNAPQGYSSSVVVYIAPPWAAGKPFFAVAKTHFVMTASYPKGMRLACPGAESCLICQGKQLALEHGDAALQKRAKDFGRVSFSHLYNVFLLELANEHYREDGVMRPFILRAGSTVHEQIGNFISERGGALKIIDPMQGRPLRITKRKDGPLKMDIKYSVIDLDPMPLPPTFYPAMSNLWDLESINKVPDNAEMLKIVTELQFPIPGVTGASYQALPQPQNPSPYMPPQAPSAPPMAFPEAPMAPMSPPPVQSGPNTGPYVPQPSQAPSANAMAGGARADGRDRCFGQYNAGDTHCAQCPPDLKMACQPVSAQNSPEAQTPPVRQPVIPEGQVSPPELMQLQQKLSGK